MPEDAPILEKGEFFCFMMLSFPVSMEFRHTLCYFNERGNKLNVINNESCFYWVETLFNAL